MIFLAYLRILKSDHNQKGVFHGEADKERCKQMFEQMEDIMAKVGFTKDVSHQSQATCDYNCRSTDYSSIIVNTLIYNIMVTYIHVKTYLVSSI